MPWTDGLDETALGHAKLNGWQPEGNAEEIARAAVVRHMEASRQLGADPKQFVRLPADANDAEGYQRLYDVLGAAKDPKDYAFADVRFKDGSPVEDAFAEQLRATAAKLHLSPAQAAELAKDIVGWADSADAGEADADKLAFAAADAQLHQNWGGNYEGFKFDAQRAAALLGLTPQLAESVAKAHPQGYAAGMDMWRQIAVKLGEAKLTGSGEGGGGQKAMSRDEAIAQRDALKNDPSFIKRYLTATDPGHKAAMDEMNHLTQVIVGAAFGRNA